MRELESTSQGHFQVPRPENHLSAPSHMNSRSDYLGTTDQKNTFKHDSYASKSIYASTRDGSVTHMHDLRSSSNALSTHAHASDSSSSESKDDATFEMNNIESSISHARSLTSEISESLSNVHINSLHDHPIEQQLPSSAATPEHHIMSNTPRRSTRPSIPPDRLDASLLYNATHPRQPHASPAFPIPAII